MDSFLCGMAPITIHKISHAEGREMVRLHGADKVPVTILQNTQLKPLKTY